VWRSDDGGDTMKRLEEHEGDVEDLAFDPAEPTLVYSGHQRLRLAGRFVAGAHRNERREVRAKPFPGPSGFDAVIAQPGPDGKLKRLIICGTASDTNRLGRPVAGLGNGVKVSHDGGRAWTPANEGLGENLNVQCLVEDPHQPDTLYAGVIGRIGEDGKIVPGGLFRSTTTPIRWTRVDACPLLHVLDIAVSPVRAGRIYAVGGCGYLGQRENKGAFRSDDNAGTWRKIFDMVPCLAVAVDHRAPPAADPKAPRPALVMLSHFGGESRGVFLSADAGETWVKINRGLALQSVPFLSFDRHLPRRIWAATDGTGWYRAFLPTQLFDATPSAQPERTSRALPPIRDESADSEVISPEGFAKLKREFHSMIEEGLHPGAQLAVFHDGALVIHLAGGVKGPGGEKIMTSAELLKWSASQDRGPGHEPVTFDTLYQIRSVTKILMMTVLMMLYDQGKFDFDDPVSKYWPEFAKNGKEAVTIAHILSHRAGLPPGPYIPARAIVKRAPVARAIENMRPMWKPGEKNGYQGVTVSMAPDEIIFRLTDRFPAIGEILREQVFGPLGLRDIYLGLPASEFPRMAKMAVLDPQRWDRKRCSDLLNSREGIQPEQSWVGGVSTARDLADFMNVFAHWGTYKGKRFFAKEVQQLVSRPTNKAGEIDQTMLRPIRWGLGFILGDTPDVYGTPPHAGAIGHVGGGATVAWADPKNKLAVAFLCNGMKNRASWKRYRRVGDLVYGALRLDPE